MSRRIRVNLTRWVCRKFGHVWCAYTPAPICYRCGRVW